jgi:ankyrin repeat protein
MPNTSGMKHRRSLFIPVTLLGLVGVCGLLLWQAKRQHALDRALIAALVHNDTRQALSLVNAGADPNTYYALPPTSTFLQRLAQWFHRSPPPVNSTPTALLIACGARWIPPLERRVPQVACEESLPLLKAMRAHGADIQARTTNGRTALHYASMIGRVATMQWLLQQGANINAQDKLGQTPLHLATQNDTTSAAHLLLTKGANPNVANIDGETTLFYAVASPIGESLMPELLAHGANPNLRDKYGKTVLQFAQWMKRPEFLVLLRKGRKRS